MSGAIRMPMADLQQDRERDRSDSLSYTSRSPFNDTPASSIPLLPSESNRRSRRVVMPEPGARASRAFDAERGARPTNSRSASWDFLGGIKRFEHGYAEFDPRNAAESHLAFAEGDGPSNGFSKLYNYLLNVSIVTRWFLFIIPVLGLLWIPGILGFTKYPNATIWAVKLLWWSIWLTVVWCGWWGSLAMAMVLPRLARHTVGLVAVASRRYIEWLAVLYRYVALFAWALTIWISYQPLINTRQESDASSDDVNIVDTVAKLLFAGMLCAAILLFEKFSIQWIAGKFHERSYAERIQAQKFAVRVLTTLYQFSSDIPGRSDTLRDGPVDKRASVNPKWLFKKALKGVRSAATTTTTALGNVASEIAGSSVLQPNSPQAKVQTALESANKSRMLARRLFYSFVRPGADRLLVDDIARFFPTPDDADAAFALFDKDMNGDATRDEVELACMECHREQLSIQHSMRDLDSAVGRLDNILMSVYFIVAILIVAVALEAQLVTLITGAGTLILGLSWLIGSSLAEVLTSIIFLFIKHPYDVGDRVKVDKETYTVKEIRLLSTIFLDSNSCLVQAPNTVLNGLFVYNIRRSDQMSESFEFDVAYSTTFEQLERLRELMIEFLKVERRDYLPSFDVMVIDMPGQEKMTLKADIKYKSNWQQSALKATRRNKWICALKSAMEKIKIFGPEGNPHAVSSPKRYTLVPWEQVQQGEKDAQDAEHHHAPHASSSMREILIPSGSWRLTDNNAALMGESGADVFNEAEELYMKNPRQTMYRGAPRPDSVVMPAMTSMPTLPKTGTEEIEMSARALG